MIREVQEKMALSPEDIFIYADDLAIILSINKLERTIQLLRDVSRNFDLKINDKKSGLLIIKKRQKNPFKNLTHVQAIPFVDHYRYLGVEIDNKGEIGTYITKIKKKAYFIESRLRPLLKSSSFEMRKSMWECFIRPLVE